MTTLRQSLQLSPMLWRGASTPPASLPDQVQSTYDYTPPALIGHLAGAAVVAWLYAGLVPTGLLLGWLAAFAAMWCARVWLVRRFRRARIDTLAEWQRWQLGWNVGALSAAALWGLSVWLFYERGGAIEQTGLILIVYTFCVAAVPVLATQPRIFLAYAALCFVPMVGRIVSFGDADNLQLAGILLLIFGITTLLTRNYRQALQRIIELKLEADRLLGEVRAEQQAAEAARLEAEAANRAKTQFLAAASHDLRQPLHAMGLFAEALRQRSHGAEVARLVDSINQSVDALDSLFSELLDISRIDGGAVRVERRAVDLGPLFQRLRLSFEPPAFEKGLTLRLRGSHHRVRTDPLLLERILRNLVANAIRYTDDGTVLVAARRRAGHVQIGVWDTGRGIAAEDQDRVFDEFVQVAGTAPAPQERKGLGLGLSIVRRLARLLEAPLALRSQPGRGSVFTLQLPSARDVDALPLPASPNPQPAAPTLEGRRILVADDDHAVRGGLEVLLASWGAQVQCFGSVAEALDWASTDAAVAPDLLIVDYQLEPGRTGIELIDGLRRLLGQPVPAIVVTGSTLSGHEQEAQVHAFHLLFKPVLPHKLRAMIGFKLGMRSA